MRFLLSIFLIAIIGCTKAATTHNVRVITFAVDQSGDYVKPSNTAMYLNKTQCVCFSDSMYGYNTNPTFTLENVNDGDELHIISFVNAGEEIQYKTVVVYVDNKMILNISNSQNINQKIKLR